MMAANTSLPPFLAIPTEIRLHICNLALIFHNEHGNRITCIKPYPTERFDARYRLPKHATSILHTCTQIIAETTGLLCQLCGVIMVWTQCCWDFVHRFPPSLEVQMNLQALTLEFTPSLNHLEVDKDINSYAHIICNRLTRLRLLTLCERAEYPTTAVSPRWWGRSATWTQTEVESHEIVERQHMMYFAAQMTGRHPLLKLALMSETRYVETDLSLGPPGVSRHKTKTLVILLPSRPPTSHASPARINPSNYRLVSQSDLSLGYAGDQEVEGQYDIVDKRFGAARLISKYKQLSPCPMCYVILNCRAIRELRWTQLARINLHNRSGLYRHKLDDFLQVATALDSESDPQLSDPAPGNSTILTDRTRGNLARGTSFA